MDPSSTNVVWVAIIHNKTKASELSFQTHFFHVECFTFASLSSMQMLSTILLYAGTVTDRARQNGCFEPIQAAVTARKYISKFSLI